MTPPMRFFTGLNLMLAIVDLIIIIIKNCCVHSNRSAAYASLHEYASALADALRTIELKPDWVKVITATHLDVGLLPCLIYHLSGGVFVLTYSYDDDDDDMMC